MRRSTNYELRLPERAEGRNDPADIDDLTYDMEIIDRELKSQADKDKELDDVKASRAELNTHASAAVLAHPDGSVTDEKIGLRSIGGVKNKLQVLLTLLGEQIKGIKGTSNWNDTPAITLTSTKQTLDSHKAVADGLRTDLDTHTADRKNPHAVTKAQVGLSNLTNDAQVKRSEMGKANGVATLDGNGQVPAAQLPSFAGDVLEYASKSNFPDSGENGKIYVALDTNLTWRWSGTAYVEISKSLALGETSSTAYPGDKGKAVADDLAVTKTAVNAAVPPTDTAGLVLHSGGTDTPNYWAAGGGGGGIIYDDDTGVEYDAELHIKNGHPVLVLNERSESSGV